MTSSEEKINHVLLKFINILFLKNPERTVLGLLLGVVFSFLSKLFSPFLKTFNTIDINEAPDLGWVALGIVIINLPVIFANMVSRPKINEEIDSVTKLIEQGNFSDIEKRKLYRDLVCKVLAKVTLKDSFSKDFEKIQKKLLPEKSVD